MGLGARRWLRRIVLGRRDGWRARARSRLRAVVFGAWPAEQPDAGSPGGQGFEGVAPPGYQAVLRAEELAPGQLVEVLVAGRTVALANVEGRFRAVSGVCPHAGGPLADGWLEGTTLTCPIHGWTFDVETGACHVDPNAILVTWDVIVEDGVVCVALPPDEAAGPSEPAAVVR